MGASMLRVTDIVGRASDPALAERLHELEHKDLLETVRLSRSDMSRRRQQVRTDRGTVLALLLDRDSELENGSILVLEDSRAVVVELDEPRWLVLGAPDVPRALQLGYFAGNMHWKVRFEGVRLCIALEGPRSDYLQRMAHLMQSGDIVVEPEPQPEPGSSAPTRSHGGGLHDHSH